jgi:alpha-glucosidase
LVFALPGSPYVYQGEELGLEQSDVAECDRQDPVWFRSGRPGRDGCRTPMPWTAQAPGHGFTSGEPWLPFDEQAATRNVELERVDPTSTYALYADALRIRRELRSSVRPELAWLVVDDEVLAFVRPVRSGDPLVVVTVTGDEPRTVDLGVPISEQLLTSGTDADIAGSRVRVQGATTVWLGVASTPAEARVSG